MSEATLILLAIMFVLSGPVALALAITASRRSSRALSELEAMQQKLDKTRRAIAFTQSEMREMQSSAPQPAASEPSTTEQASQDDPKPEATPEAISLHDDQSTQVPPMDSAAQHAATSADSSPPPIPAPVTTTEKTQSALPIPATATITKKDTKPPISLEQFMGAKLFAWLGGVAMFFGVIFFVKYAFEHNLIPPAMRVALGYLTGAALLGGGIWTHQKPAYRILAQALCATGILTLYGVTFAAHSLYQFPAFNPAITFALCVAITIAAIAIAMRYNAQVVAALGMVGGFASPLLLHSICSNTFVLFSYIGLLDIGILACARLKPWRFLPPAAVIGTLLVELRWFLIHFSPRADELGSSVAMPMAILLFFCVLFAIGAAAIHRQRPTDTIPFHATHILLGFMMAYALGFLSYRAIHQQPLLLYGFILALNLISIATVVVRKQSSWSQWALGLATFFHLALWTIDKLNTELLGDALIIYLVIGILHTSWPAISKRLGVAPPAKILRELYALFGPLMLLLMLLTVITGDLVPISLWLAVLIANAAIIIVAVCLRRLGTAMIALGITLFINATWLMKLPDEPSSTLLFLGITVLFSALFAATGIAFSRRFESNESSAKLGPASQLSILSGTLPFILLVMATLELPLTNPSPVFAVSLLLGLLLLALAVIGKRPPLSMLAAACTLAVQIVWHAECWDQGSANIALAWHAGFYAIFCAFPFVFPKLSSISASPWRACCISGIGNFLIIYALIKSRFGEIFGDSMGIIPFAFAIINLAMLWRVIQQQQPPSPLRNRQLAWLGGTTLLFITLILPAQLERQWLTVGWALEGAALIWLLRKVPHPGLKWTAIGLFALVFFRLTLNTAVFDSYPRSGSPILNWYLYTYGLAAASMITGAIMLPSEHRRWHNLPLSGMIQAAAGILLFLLLNIEIADFFTEPAQRFLTFQFGGNFARDMTYSIGWGLFSLGLLGLGIYRSTPVLRYAAIALLTVTLLKVFFHDLSRIENIYRIGALIGVAIIAFITSFLYQRYSSRVEGN